MMRSPTVRVATSLFGAFLAFLQTASGQLAPGLTLLSTPQGPMTADLKWPAGDDSVQRSRFDLQTRKRLGPPPAPSNLAVEDSGAEGVTVSFGSPEGFATTFQLERSPAFASPVLVAAATGTYSDPTGPGVFQYRARAINAAGASPYSDWASTTVAQRPPVPPSNMTAANLGDGSAQLGWSDNSSSETRFEIQRSPAFPLGVSVAANIEGYTDVAGPGMFYYRVRAVNAAGASDYTGWVQVSIMAPVPTAPSGMTATDQFNATARLAWADNSNNETGFQIQRNPSFPTGLVAVGAGATSYVDPCGPGSFSYRVRAVNTAGGSAFTSPWVSVTIVTPGLAVPTNVTAEDTHTRRALVKWTDTSSTETGFEIQRSPAFSAPVQVGAGVTAYVDQCGVGTFSYRVRTLGPGGPTAYSSWAQVQILNTIPSAPTALTLQDMGNQSQIRVAWTDTSDNETSFKIRREQQVSGNWVNGTNLAAAANATSYLDNPGLGTYRYRVASSNSVGDSAYTAWTTLVVSTGWTLFTPSADTRIVYVSNSTGNDNNTGLSESAPKRTLAGAYSLLRHGYPDWMLLKRGDVWTTPLPSWKKSGRSSTQMMVVGSYGSSSQRPEIRPQDDDGIYISGGGGSPPTIDHLALVGLHFAGAGANQGINMYKPGSDLLIEDCAFIGFSLNVNIQGDNTPFDGIRLRRCVIADAYSTSSHSQGVYADLVNNLLIEECVFDHNGWKEGVAGATIFNHNIYIQSNCGPAVVRNNIIARASSHGVQTRPGGQVINNLFVQNAMAGFVAKSASTMAYNVVTNGVNIDGDPRACGFEIIADTPPSVIESNLFLKPDVVNANSYAIYVGAAGMDIKNNVVYDWASTHDGAVQFAIGGGFSIYQGTRFTGNKIVLPTMQSAVVNIDAGPWASGIMQVSGNRYWSSRGASQWFEVGASNLSLASWASLTGDPGTSFPASSFPGASRDIAGYNASQGGAANIQDFLARARQQSKLNWNPAYTAPVVNTWMRAGFQIAEP